MYFILVLCCHLDGFVFSFEKVKERYDLAKIMQSSVKIFFRKNLTVLVKKSSFGQLQVLIHA